MGVAAGCCMVTRPGCGRGGGKGPPAHSNAELRRAGPLREFVAKPSSVKARRRAEGILREMEEAMFFRHSLIVILRCRRHPQARRHHGAGWGHASERAILTS